MALTTGGFQVSKLTVSQILQLVPTQPLLLTEKYFKEQEEGHPLGIGWNKIEFHRDFCRYSELIQPNRNKGGEQLTGLGMVVSQYDPDLSDLNSWWLFHSNLAANSETNIYHNLFARFPHHPASRDFLVKELGRVLTTPEITIKKDLGAILGWFEKPPFASLGLLVTDGQYWLRRNPTRLPAAEMVAYAAFNLQSLEENRSNSTKLSNLLKGPKSLATIFGLKEETLKRLLREATNMLGSKILSISETAGLDTIYFGSGNNLEIWQIVQSYYQTHTRESERAS